MSGLPIRKLYVDTKFKTADSTSNSDFKFQLPRSAFMPVDSTFVIDEINIPYSWNTVEKDINDQMYIGWTSPSTGIRSHDAITIPPKRYDGAGLASQIQTSLGTIGAGSASWTATYDYTLNNITISSGNPTFKVFSDGDLKILTTTGYTDAVRQNPKSINDIIQIEGVATTALTSSPSTPFITGFLNLLNYQDLYLTSASMGSFDSQGPRGESTIIRKICVNSAWGFSIIDKLSLGSDVMSCSKLSLSTIDFQLRDVRGRIVPLHGAHMSFVIKFGVE